MPPQLASSAGPPANAVPVRPRPMAIVLTDISRLDRNMSTSSHNARDTTEHELGERGTISYPRHPPSPLTRLVIYGDGIDMRVATSDKPQPIYLACRTCFVCCCCSHPAGDR